MCGIAGIVSFDNNTDIKSKFLDILRTQNHRGPDDLNAAYHNNISLGHNRLSIIDLVGGKQPMYSNNNGSMISFNGEIYGYEKLKSKTKYNYKTKSDTELILALYEEYDLSFLDFLPGMFAFAIWDFKKKKLILARDRFGEKPLYYAISKNGEFIFASEIKAIIKSGLIDLEISKEAIGEYLQNLCVVNDSIYKNIKKLKPGFYIEFSEGKLIEKQFYNYPSTNHSISFEEGFEKFKYLFEKSLENQFISDVPLGVLLSGGLDSSYVASVGKKINPKIKTFTFNFSQDNNLDSEYSKSVIDKFKINNIELSDKGINIEEMLLKMNDIFDEPFADSSNIPTYLITKEAKKYVKVLIGGDGADELLGGYDWRYLPYLNKNKKNVFLKSLYFKILFKLLKKQESYYSILRSKKFEFSSYLDAAHSTGKYFNNNQLQNLINCKPINKKIYFSEEDNFNDFLKYDLCNYLQNDILKKTDMTSMFNSIELRSPFLDYELSDFIISLPSNFKIEKNQTKRILKESSFNFLPNKVINRKKQGFGSPVGSWLNRKEMTQMKNQIFNENNPMYEFIDYNSSKNYFEKNDYQTWILLVLGLWFNKQ